MKTKESTRYTGEYRNVAFSINKTKGFSEYSNDFHWTHYIHLNLDKQIADKTIAESLWLEPKYDEQNRTNHDYYVSPINEIEFHGGCTWYSKESSPDDIDRVVKIGCDYQHSWDDNKDYSVEYIKTQVRETIDSFLKISPVMKWCNGCGAYYKDVSKDGCGKCKYSKDKY